MSGVATAIVGSAVIGSMASRSAANTAADAANRATDAQREAFNKQTALNQPFYDTGVTALNKLSSQPTYTPDTFNYEADPGYAFRFNEGMKGVNANAAVRGGLLSGNALRAASDYGQASGSQEYNNAYNRYVTNQGIKLGAFNTNTGVLQNLASMGQGSANNQAAAAGAFGNSAASNIIGAGNANAAGTVGAANALTSGLSTGLNYYQNQNMLNAFNDRTKSAYANQAMNQYGSGNVYGYGGQGQVPTSPDFSVDTF
jgi:hypothetical protein